MGATTPLQPTSLVNVAQISMEKIHNMVVYGTKQSKTNKQSNKYYVILYQQKKKDKTKSKGERKIVKVK